MLSRSHTHETIKPYNFYKTNFNIQLGKKIHPTGITELPDGGQTRTTAVNAVKRSRRILIHGLLNRDSLGIANDGVRRDHSGLIGVVSDVVMVVMLLGHRGLIGRVVGDPDRRLAVGLRHSDIASSIADVDNLFKL